MTKTVTALLLAVLVLLVGGCGSSSSGSSSASSSTGANDAKATRSISAQLLKSQSSASANPLLRFKKPDADCVAKGLVSHLGVTKLQTYGLLDKKLNAKGNVSSLKMSAVDAGQAAAAITGCVDVKKVMLSAVDKAGAVPAKTKACISRALSDPLIRQVLSKGFQGKASQIQGLISKPVSACALTGNGG